MKRFLRGALCVLLCCAALFGTVQSVALASDAVSPSEFESDEGRERPDLEDMRVYVGGLLSGRAFKNGDDVYMSLADISEIYNVKLNISLSENGFTVSAPSLEMKVEKDSGYVEVNGRYLYLPDGYIVCGDDVYLPIDIISRVFSLGAEIKDDSVQINATQVRMISGGENYYETTFSADELYWLPHIAYVEAFEQPLAGIMGVINVVLNRVEDEDFPDTIFEVIYDSEHTIQFTPASLGSMHGTPTELYYIATYLVLEGYNAVGESLYYVNPENNANYWFRENLEYVTTIGDHEFYK